MEVLVLIKFSWYHLILSHKMVVIVVACDYEIYKGERGRIVSSRNIRGLNHTIYTKLHKMVQKN